MPLLHLSRSLQSTSFARKLTGGVGATLLAYTLFGRLSQKEPAPPAALLPVQPAAYRDVSGVKFVDKATEAGLRYRWTITGTRPMTLLQTIGNGCAFLDYDNDGNLDVLLVGDHPALFKGDGHGHFTEVTHAVGLDTLRGHFLGCAVGDYDNDGYNDLYLSGYHTGILLHNERGRLFRDVTNVAGLTALPWGTSCGFADLSGEGRLDLFVASYVQFEKDTAQSPSLCTENHVLTSCSPLAYLPGVPALYRNLGGGRFRDEHRERLTDAVEKGLGVAFADCLNDGHPDLYVANDTTACNLFLSDGGGHLDNWTRRSGTAYGPTGAEQSGMGVDAADYDNDGKMDFVVSTFAGEAKSLYHNEGVGLFTNVGSTVGLGPGAAPYVSFGVKWLDYDNDGWPDLMLASGHIKDNVAQTDPGKSFHNPTQLFRNLGRNPPGSLRFVDVSTQAGPDLQRPILGRGLATGDYDNDGRIDALIVDAEGTPLLLHNEGGQVGNWLGLRLVGTSRSNRDALGARVTLEAGGHSWVKEVQTAGSYLSASDKRLLFGLGKATHTRRVTVCWPDGKTQIWNSLPINHYYRLEEGRQPNPRPENSL